MSTTLGATPPYNTDQMRRYLAQLYLAKVGKTTADHARNAVDWWHEVHNIPSPCNESIVRLCDAMHRDLPKQGNKARRALTTKEGAQLLTLSDARIKSSGDHWHRNSTILALDLCTGLRISDILSLRHGDLKWFSNPLQVTIWIADGKKDTFSDGAQSILYIADNKDPNDGICRLWDFTRRLKGIPSEFIFKSFNKESHISYDSMLGVLHDLAKTGNLPSPDLIGWHSCRKTRADQEHGATDGDMDAVRSILGHSKNSHSTNYYLSHPPTTNTKR